MQEQPCALRALSDLTGDQEDVECVAVPCVCLIEQQGLYEEIKDPPVKYWPTVKGILAHHEG